MSPTAENDAPEPMPCYADTTPHDPHTWKPFLGEGPTFACPGIEPVYNNRENVVLGLTDDEHAVVRQAGDLWGAICAAIPDGPTRDADLAELVIHVHAIQHAVMANAAARAHPDTYRLLGGSMRTHVIPPGESDA